MQDFSTLVVNIKIAGEMIQDESVKENNANSNHNE